MLSLLLPVHIRTINALVKYHMDISFVLYNENEDILTNSRPTSPTSRWDQIRMPSSIISPKNSGFDRASALLLVCSNVD
jgi:hypothetical protein